jgi:nucleotide-binding universal stress UspA family protein
MGNAMVFGPQHIVCAVDFSPSTQGVLQAGNLLARAFDAQLSVFHAVTTSREGIPGTAIYDRGGRHHDLLADARRRLEELAAPLEKAGAVAVAGDPVEALSAIDREMPADLVVAARRGFSGLQRVLLGSVVERMARRFAKPFLVTRRGDDAAGQSLRLRNVAVACKTVTASTPALRVAVALSKRFDAALLILHAMELPIRPEVLEPTSGPYTEVQAALQDRLHDDMVRLVRTAATDLDVSVKLAPGPAAEILPRFVVREQVDLLVVGVQPRRRLEQLFIGSTTEAALRHTACAVLTVPETMT